MKSKLGKITIGLIVALVIFAAISVTSLSTREAQAYNVAAQTFVLPSSSTVTHDANTYIILWDRATGHLIKDDGTAVVANAWTDGDIATTVHAENGTVWLATMPALDVTKNYVMAVYNNVAPAKTDVPTMGPFLYDPSSNMVFTDTNPLNRYKVKI